MIIKGLKFSIMGMARSGIATALKILEHNGSLFISEIKTEEESRKAVLSLYDAATWEFLRPHCEFGNHSSRILDCDILIISPGINPDNLYINRAREKGIKIISEIEFGFLIKDKGSKIIAVTGSNGKSTTVSLIDHIMHNAGYKTILCGNIGNPLTSFPIEKPGIDYWVLELSSFQLELIERFAPETAVLLNISPDHLDRHKSLENYVNIKMNIFRNQGVNDRSILNAEDNNIMSRIDVIRSRRSFFGLNRSETPSNSVGNAYLEGKKIVWTREHPGRSEQQIIETEESHLIGIHNRQNIMAALLAVDQAVQDVEVIRESIRTFKPLAHRLEMIREISGVEFINDSKATNTDSVKFALTAFERPVHLIAGGYEKGEDYTVLLPYLKDNVKRIYLIGNSRTKMQLAFQSISKKVSTHRTMLEAVNAAYNEAGRNEIVLLSPACASYDMYKNFEQRGKVFRAIVAELEEK